MINFGRNKIVQGGTEAEVWISLWCSDDEQGYLHNAAQSVNGCATGLLLENPLALRIG